LTSPPSAVVSGRTNATGGGGGGCTTCGVGPDLNGDGKPDLVWLNDSTRQAVVWYLGGSQGNVVQGSDWLSSGGIAGWTVVGIRDFNGDGKPDLVWQNDATQQVVVWYLGGSQGNTPVGSNWLAQDGVAGWYVVATGDFNGDGKPDLVWQNAARQVVVWYMGGAQGNIPLWGDWLSSTGVPGWRVVGTGDFNGDGRLDLVWQYDWTRQAVVWFMGGTNGNSYQGGAWLTSTDVWGWTLVGTADFNGDSKPDLVWQNDETRQLVAWYGGGADGNSYLGGDWLASDPVPGWRVIAR
jgi:serralysin